MHWYSILFALAFTANACAYESTNVNVSKPENNAPLDQSLAYYRLDGYNGDGGQQLTHGFFSTRCGANLSVHYSLPAAWDGHAGTVKKPILLLTHGYPESSYIWRNVAPSISKRVPVFIPDQPGYGLSTPCCNATSCAYDKRTYAQAIMQAVTEIYGDSHVIYAGHDWGGRTMVNTSTGIALHVR